MKKRYFLKSFRPGQGLFLLTLLESKVGIPHFLPKFWTQTTKKERRRTRKTTFQFIKIDFLVMGFFLENGLNSHFLPVFWTKIG